MSGFLLRVPSDFHFSKHKAFPVKNIKKVNVPIGFLIYTAVRTKQEPPLTIYKTEGMHYDQIYLYTPKPHISTRSDCFSGFLSELFDFLTGRFDFLSEEFNFPSELLEFPNELLNIQAGSLIHVAGFLPYHPHLSREICEWARIEQGKIKWLAKYKLLPPTVRALT